VAQCFGGVFIIMYEYKFMMWESQYEVVLCNNQTIFIFFNKQSNLLYRVIYFFSKIYLANINGLFVKLYNGHVNICPKVFKNRNLYLIL
jgi:hypothetical protein